MLLCHLLSHMCLQHDWGQDQWCECFRLHALLSVPLVQPYVATLYDVTNVPAAS